MIYGQEKARFSYKFDGNTWIENTFDWKISDKNLDSSDNSDFYQNKERNFKPTKIFKSSGQKQIEVQMDFDDGWGNIYTHKFSKIFPVLPYEHPSHTFKTSPENPRIFQNFEVTQEFNETRPKGNILSVSFDMNNDGIFEFENLNKNDTFNFSYNIKKTFTVNVSLKYWDGWEEKTYNYTKDIILANTPPISDFTKQISGICVPKYIFTDNSSDLDGALDIVSKVFELYKEVSPNVFAKIDSKILEGNSQTFEYQFAFEGKYKIVFIVKDKDNAESVKEEIFEVNFGECEGSSIINNQIPINISGKINLEVGWQLIAIPTVNGYFDKTTGNFVLDDTVSTVKNYIVDQLIYKLNLNSEEELKEYVQVMNAFRGGVLSQNYIVGVTSEQSTHNFNLSYLDGDAQEVTAFWINVLKPVPPLEWKYFKFS